MAMYKIALAIALVLVTVSAAQPATDHLSPVRDHKGRFLPRDLLFQDDRALQVRQPVPENEPPTTTDPVCDQYDNYFYITPRNYTWQLQCTTNYEGNVVVQLEGTSYANCFVSCADYNRANGLGACIAITLNGGFGSSIGLCTLYSTVTNLLLASEEGGVQDSALLVRSPNGTVFATPRPGPSFSGQPSQPPTIDPVPTATGSTTIVFTTSVITITACPPGVSCSVPPASISATSSTTTLPTSSIIVVPPSTNPNNVSSPPPSSSTIASSSGSISISDGGTRPGTITSSPVSSITTIPVNTVDGQLTITTVVTYTVYQVQVVALCPPTPGSCSQTTTRYTSIGSRTQLRCTPSVCTGDGLVTNAIADVAAAACIEPA